MIIERLILHNFGPYHGRHVFELMPQPGKPVSLLIGLNGAGKTTVLQALQLAFYGTQAPAVEYYANAGGCTFEEYLDQSISYWPRVEHSASVEVEFRAVRGGKERHHLLRRFWKRPPHDGSVVNTQKLEVFVDGMADPALASAWPEAIEELLPLPLSTLFFFDGEKIDRWANSLSTAELVTQAVRSLLGLDVIDRALADLQTLKRDEAAARQKSADAQEEQALDAALAELGRFVQRRDEIQAQLA
jgi:DNA sulfur modification protein DndD